MKSLLHWRPFRAGTCWVSLLRPSVIIYYNRTALLSEWLCGTSQAPCPCFSVHLTHHHTFVPSLEATMMVHLTNNRREETELVVGKGSKSNGLGLGISCIMAVVKAVPRAGDNPNLQLRGTEQFPLWPPPLLCQEVAPHCPRWEKREDLFCGLPRSQEACKQKRYLKRAQVPALSYTLKSPGSVSWIFFWGYPLDQLHLHNITQISSKIWIPGLGSLAALLNFWRWVFLAWFIVTSPLLPQQLFSSDSSHLFFLPQPHYPTQPTYSHKIYVPHVALLPHIFWSYWLPPIS